MADFIVNTYVSGEIKVVYTRYPQSVDKICQKQVKKNSIYLISS